MAKNDRNKYRYEGHQAQGGLMYCLEVLGDQLGKKHKWKNDLDGLDAVRFYLMQKHHWLPFQVRAMSGDDLRFAMSEELAGWTLPKEARVPAGS